MVSFAWMTKRKAGKVYYMSEKNQINLSFFTLLLLISFASVNAVLFTPALPKITDYFHITENLAQQTITWFLVGYAIGQLLYGPIANRFGRKPALFIGVGLQIFSSLLSVLAGHVHEYGLLVFARFLLALGSGVGLKMTFTLVNETYEPKAASQKISYLMLAFAITPGLGVALRGILTTYFNWTSCFYAGAIYGFILLLLVIKLPEKHKKLDLNALKLKHLWYGYVSQFKNHQLVLGGFLMGSSTCFIYIFASISPFIVINLLGMTSADYGFANMLPPIGLILGSLIGARLTTRYALVSLLKIGVLMTVIGTAVLFCMIKMGLSPLISIFLPMIIVYLGLCFILPNASTIAMSTVSDKAHGSAVMSFLNMGLATVAVLLSGYFSITVLLLPYVYIALCCLMLGLLGLTRAC